MSVEPLFSSDPNLSPLSNDVYLYLGQILKVGIIEAVRWKPKHVKPEDDLKIKAIAEIIQNYTMYPDLEYPSKDYIKGIIQLLDKYYS